MSHFKMNDYELGQFSYGWQHFLDFYPEERSRARLVLYSLPERQGSVHVDLVHSPIESAFPALPLDIAHKILDLRDIALGMELEDIRLRGTRTIEATKKHDEVLAARLVVRDLIERVSFIELDNNSAT